MNAEKGHEHSDSPQDRHAMNPNKHYRNLLIMAALSFLSMYILMYAMVNVLGNVYNNLNQIYMAGLMTAPMVIIELVLMKMMNPDKRRNAVIMAASILVGIVFFISIRQQAAISDKQFLRSMIPHHAGAITMCERAPIRDPEIQELCRNIISSQQAEIDLMQAKLDEPGK